MCHIVPTAGKRPALKELVAAMAKLSRRQHLEIAMLGRRAKAAKAPRTRRLTREANAEAKRLASVEA
jgi:hypothetical protein